MTSAQNTGPVLKLSILETPGDYDYKAIAYSEETPPNSLFGLLVVEVGTIFSKFYS